MNRVQFGAGRLAELPAELLLAGITHPLVVTDRGVVAARRLALLPPGVAVHDFVPANPHEAAVRAATIAYRRAGADGVIGLGGGSAMDLAKAVALAPSSISTSTPSTSAAFWKRWTRSPSP